MGCKRIKGVEVRTGFFFGMGVLCAWALWAEPFITYEQFGAVGDGKTDDQAAIVAAHRAANEQGLPVRADDTKTYYIGEGSSRAVIKTDVDFGKARFVIDDRTVKQRSADIFSVESSLAPVPLKGVETLKRGEGSLGITLPADSLVALENNRVKRYIRYGANQNNGTAQQEVILVNKRGEVDSGTPIIWDYDTVTRITAYPLDEKVLTVKGGIFTTIANQAESKYTYYGRGIRIHRSNVRVEGVRHEVTGEGDHGAPYGGFLSISLCANVTVTGCVFTAHKTYRTIGSAGRPVSMGSYDLNANKAVNVSFIGCRQTTDILDSAYWGLFGSNFCKNLLYDDCVFSRFDAHMGVANATIRNSRLGYMGINAIGFGTLRVENSTVYGRNFIGLRPDYGSTWEGAFIITNCVFIPACGREAEGTLIGGSNPGTHDFGYPCHMPRRIVIDGLKIDDTHHPESYQGPWLFAAFNPKNRDASYVEQYPYRVTEEVELRHVQTVSGKALRLSPNPYLFRNVKGFDPPAR